MRNHRFIAEFLAKNRINYEIGKNWACNYSTMTIFAPIPIDEMKEEQLGILIHEASHLLFTKIDGKTIAEKLSELYPYADAGKIFQIANVLEDLRIEKNIIKKYKGTEEYLEKSKLYALSIWRSEDGKRASGLKRALIYFLMGKSREIYEKIDVNELPKDFISPEMMEKLRKWEEMNEKDINSYIQYPGDISDCFPSLLKNVIPSFIDIFLEKKQLEQGQSERTKQGQSKLSEQKNKEIIKKIKDNLKKIIKENKKSIDNLKKIGKIKEILSEEKIKEIKKILANRKIKEIKENKESIEEWMPVAKKRNINNYIPLADFDKKEIVKIIKIIKDKDENKTEYLQKKGSIDPIRLLQASLSDKDDFYKKISSFENKQGYNKKTAYAILVDLSGSMRLDDRDIFAHYSINAINDVLSKSGKPYMITGFNRLLWPIKAMSEKKTNKDILDNFNGIIRLNTDDTFPASQNYDNLAIDYAKKELEKMKGYKKIIFVLSDGDPCCTNEELNNAISSAEKSGIELYSIGINTTATSIFYKNDVYLDDPKNLFSILLGIFKKINNIKI